MINKLYLKINFKIAGKILLFFFMLYVLTFLSMDAFAKVNKNVLFISSYSESFVTVPEQIDGIKSVFKDKDVNLDIEYMDMKKYDSEEHLENFYNDIKYKLESNVVRYDVILVGDDAALQFAIDHQNDLFQDIPIVFLCINDIQRAKNAISSKQMTGIMEIGNPLNKTIEIANKFYPQAKRVVAILDDTLTGQGDRKQFYAEDANFPNLLFEEANVSKYSFDEFKDVLQDFKEDTILVYMCMFKDKDGNFKDIDDAVEFIAQHTDIPVFRHSVGGVGQGLIGGKMISYYDSGIIAAEMVLDILDGTAAADIPMIEVCPDRYFFDYDLIQKFNIDTKLIPKDAVIINAQMSFFEQYKKIIATISIIMLVSFLFILVLTIDNIKRRVIEKELKQVNYKLNKAYGDLTVSEEELRSQFDTIQLQVNEILLLNQKYENAISNIEGAIWEYDIITKNMSISADMIGINRRINTREGRINQVLSDVFSSESIKKFKYEIDMYLNKEIAEVNVEMNFIDYEQKEKWFLARGKGVFDSKGDACIIHGILLDITKIKEEEKYIEFLAEHDYLTKLPNRFLFMKKLENEIEQGNFGSVFLLDVDNFKGINDTLGHNYGDKVLIAISKRLQSLVDENFFVCRHGGDEFLILLTGIESDEVHNYAKKLLDLFINPLIIEGRENYISCSMGITNFPSDSSNIEQLIMNADTAMYKVKRDGRNNYMFYFEELNEELKSKIDLEHLLRKTLKNNDLKLVYQPQVNVTTGEIVGFEALLRINNANISIINFISLAEELGLIVEIGRWVTKEAIKQAAIWKNKGFNLKTIAVNFSSPQIRDNDYINFLKQTLEYYKVSPEYIEIEITESILLEKTQKTLNFLNELKNLGVSLALDDFGTGYSSLSYLTYIPVDKVKFDKSLNDKFLDLKDTQFMQSLVSLVHGLNMKVTAEGIEEKSQLERLKSINCDLIQGFLFSRPLPPEEIELIYNNNFMYNQKSEAE